MSLKPLLCGHFIENMGIIIYNACFVTVLFCDNQSSITVNRGLAVLNGVNLSPDEWKDASGSR
jgi:hypothetical protein